MEASFEDDGVHEDLENGGEKYKGHSEKEAYQASEDSREAREINEAARGEAEESPEKDATEKTPAESSSDDDKEPSPFFCALPYMWPFSPKPREQEAKAGGGADAHADDSGTSEHLQTIAKDKVASNGKAGGGDTRMEEGESESVNGPASEERSDAVEAAEPSSLFCALPNFWPFSPATEAARGQAAASDGRPEAAKLDSDELAKADLRDNEKSLVFCALPQFWPLKDQARDRNEGVEIEAGDADGRVEAGRQVQVEEVPAHSMALPAEEALPAQAETGEVPAQPVKAEEAVDATKPPRRFVHPDRLLKPVPKHRRRPRPAAAGNTVLYLLLAFLLCLLIFLTVLFFHLIERDRDSAGGGRAAQAPP